MVCARARRHDSGMDDQKSRTPGAIPKVPRDDLREEVDARDERIRRLNEALELAIDEIEAAGERLAA